MKHFGDVEAPKYKQHLADTIGGHKIIGTTHYGLATNHEHTSHKLIINLGVEDEMQRM